MRAPPAWLIALFLPLPGQALELSPPANAELTAEVVRADDSYLLPVGPFSQGTIETRRIEGRIVQQAWRIEAQAMTTLQLLAPMRATLRDGGYDILYECSGEECGGFDFRFETDVLPAPDIFVDLSDFRYLSARGGDAERPDDFVSLLVSRMGATGYVQIIHAVPGDAVDGGPAAVPAEVKPGGAEPESSGIAQGLMREGHVILQDLDFESGSVALGDGPYESLAALAAFLKGDAARRIALVGHTDTVGGLQPNTDLSRRRAAAVLERLVSAHGVPRDQVESGGMGYLAPIATNMTAEGREANRRVEAILLGAE